MEIRYERIVHSQAMSKSPYQSGLSLTHFASNNTIKIQSINPRLNTITSYLSMQIPVEEIDNVIKALLELKNKINER